MVVVAVAAEVARTGDRAAKDEGLALDTLGEDGLCFRGGESLVEERLGCREVRRHGVGSVWVV